MSTHTPASVNSDNQSTVEAHSLVQLPLIPYPAPLLEGEKADIMLAASVARAYGIIETGNSSRVLAFNIASSFDYFCKSLLRASFLKKG